SNDKVAAGGLIAYGASLPDLFRRAAAYAHRILQGTKPADLPVELQPSSTWRSTSRLPARSASTCRRCSSLVPTRGSSEAPRLHHTVWRSGCMATRGACAEADAASGRIIE